MYRPWLHFQIVVFETKNCNSSGIRRGVIVGRGAPFVGTWLPTFTENVRVKQSKKNGGKKKISDRQVFDNRESNSIQLLLLVYQCS
jgi:hypothetical protein